MHLRIEQRMKKVLREVYYSRSPEVEAIPRTAEDPVGKICSEEC